MKPQVSLSLLSFSVAHRLQRRVLGNCCVFPPTVHSIYSNPVAALLVPIRVHTFNNTRPTQEAGALFASFVYGPIFSQAICGQRRLPRHEWGRGGWARWRKDMWELWVLEKTRWWGGGIYDRDVELVDEERSRGRWGQRKDRNKVWMRAAEKECTCLLCLLNIEKILHSLQCFHYFSEL